MRKLCLAILLCCFLAGCSSNPDAPSAPSESSVPKGDGSAPKNSPGVLKPPGRRVGGATKGGGASTPAER